MAAGKLSKSYAESVAICEMDPDDMKTLGVAAGQLVRVSTQSGSVVVRAAASTSAPHRGIAFIPLGPWASAIMEPKTHGTGMPSLKGLRASVEPAEAGAELTTPQLRGVRGGG